MVGRTLKETKPRATVATGDVALELRHLSNRELGLSDVSFSVQRGEVLGIAGLVGSGRTELAETLFGLVPSDGGEVLRPWSAGAHRLAAARRSSWASATCRRIAAGTA